MKHDAHNYSKRLEVQLRLLNDDKAISADNKELIREFKDYSFCRGLSKGRITRYLFDLRTLSHMLGKNFKDAGKEDIFAVVGKLETSDRYAKSTIRDFKLTLRIFYRWLRKTDVYPDEVSWIRANHKNNRIKNPEDMLTEEEVRKLIDACRNPRDRAFIATLYESGCRIGEILLLKINEVIFDRNGAQLLVDGKTGFRRVRVIISAPFLLEWLNKHPLKREHDAFLWIDRKDERLEYASASGLLKRAAKKACVRKKVNPHNFRHSRATYLANHLTEAQMKEHFGWVQGSDMASIYVHLSGRDVDNALLKVYGMQNGEEKRESILKPKECARCQLSNQATNRFCSRCGLPLDEEAKTEVMRKDMERKEADQLLDRLLNDGEFREMFVRKINQTKPTQ